MPTDVRPGGPARPRPPAEPGAGWDALRRTGVLIRHNTAVLLHEPGPLIGRLVMPIMLLTALRPLYEQAQGPRGTGQAVVGSLVTFSLLALSIVGGSIRSTLPGWLRSVSPLSPGYWAARALRHAAAGDTGPMLRGAAVLLAVGVACGAVACRRVARGWGRELAV